MPRVRLQNSLEIYYELHGSGIPVVFINGLTSSLETWYYQIAPFSSRYKVIVYDCRGQGKSDKPLSGYTGTHHTEDLINLLNELGIEKAHIVGHSFGGFVALNFALTCPSRAGTLVISDITSEANPLIEKILTGWVKAQEYGGMELRFDVSVPWLYSGGFIRKNHRKITLFRRAFKRLDREATRSITMESLSNNATERLKDIQSPTLLLVGEEDILTPPRYTTAMKDSIPHARMVILKDCAHVPPIENPDEFNREVLDFLKDYDHLFCPQ